MEKDRILYEKMKAQSDRMLMNLNIRTAKHRIRGSVAPDDHEEGSDDGECRAGECTHEKRIVGCAPSNFNTFAVANKGSRIVTLCVPCDLEESESTKIISPIEDSLTEVLKSLPCHRKDIVFSKFTKPLCVCGQCDDTERKLTGSLRSVAMLLKGGPSVVVTRNGGLQGMWSSSQGELSQFLKKHIS